MKALRKCFNIVLGTHAVFILPGWFSATARTLFVHATDIPRKIFQFCHFTSPALAGTTAGLMQKFTSLLLLPVVLFGCTPVSRKSDSLQTATPGNRAQWPGRQLDGSVLLPNAWSLRPAGRQVELGDFPVNIAVHPGGRFAAILHSGYSEHQIIVIDLQAGGTMSRTRLKETFYGIEFSKDGKHLFCSGAGDEVVHEYDFENGVLSNHKSIPLRPASETGVPAGLAVDGHGEFLYAANVWGHRVTQVTLGPETRALDIPLGTNLTQLAPPVQPAADFETAAAEKRALAELYASKPTDTFPYACRLDDQRNRLYVSLWSQASVAVVDVASKQVIARWPSEEHPCEMTLTRNSKVLFVANASRNTVTLFDTATGRPLETICSALYPQAPPGSTPNSLALTPDDRTLFIANADNNLVAVFDVSSPGQSRALGFIPAGWYPTSVRLTPDGKHLLIANGKGLSSLPNPRGPKPGVNNSDGGTVQYIARLFHGSLSIIDLPVLSEREKWLAACSAEAYKCSPLRPDSSVVTSQPNDSPVPIKVGDPSPVRYCLYIIKENRTYDQVLGDIPNANGDASLCLFPERVTPNLHRLVREFVLLDNFYVDSEVSADGHEWSMGAYATDFVEKMWPLDYGHNGSGKFPYPAEGDFPIAAPTGGYLWDLAREAGVTYRSYGEFASNPRSSHPARARVKTLEGHIDEQYMGFDLSYSDVKRADRFIAELKRFEAAGEMPYLQIIRLPNDHTHGTTLGFRTPTAYIAENDLALGRLVDAVSHSKFWPQTAIFVVEDDAQNGSDHVDAHRTTAFVISPYAKRGAVDSSLYSTSSMLRTMELILGLKPMSQFDAAARPMFGSFQPKADLRPYQALPANVDLEQRNGHSAWGGELKLNFAREDAIDDLLLNEIVWRSVRGANNPMPAPVRAGFVRVQPHHVDRD
jgi:DNA-binding beta-propeller fold protein YncE